jgi:hypothetical protein
VRVRAEAVRTELSTSASLGMLPPMNRGAHTRWSASCAQYTARAACAASLPVSESCYISGRHKLTFQKASERRRSSAPRGATRNPSGRRMLPTTTDVREEPERSQRVAELEGS